MHPVIKPLVDNKCPKCGGQRYTERDVKFGVVCVVCLNCGKEEYA